VAIATNCPLVARRCPQWWFHGPSGTISSLIRQAFVKPSKYGQLTNRLFHRYKAYNALLKSLVSVGKEKLRFENTIFLEFFKIIDFVRLIFQRRSHEMKHSFCLSAAHEIYYRIFL